MAPTREWRDSEDMRLAQLRGYGRTWTFIGREMGVSPQTAADRWHWLEREGRVVSIAHRNRHGISETIRGAEALPAGHPLTWRPLIAGTILEGSPYEP